MLLKGVPASRGIVIGPALVLGGIEPEVRKGKLHAQEVEPELVKLQKASQLTREQLLDLKRKVANEVGLKQAEIFNAHLLFLDDPNFLVETSELIRRERVTAAWSVWQYVERYAKLLAQMDEGHLGERGGDVRDVGRRLIDALRGGTTNQISILDKKSVLVAHDLAPSEAAQADLSKVLGFATDAGGPTSHTAIIARTLELPAVVGLESATRHVKTGDLVILDGVSGALVVNPDKETLAHYKNRQRELQQREQALRRLRRLPAVTKDGHRLSLQANIDLPEEARGAMEKGAEGVGLFRTEFLFLNRHNLPTEEEQFQAYRMALRACDPHVVTVRTLDLGGDKFLAHLGLANEMNPYLGLRAIRLCLAHTFIFKVQLRAILRASHYGKLRLMYPLISGLEELRQANQILSEVKRDLAKRGVPYDEKLQVGAMVEVPSAALIADLLAKECDFFSVGTNDLIQYTMAVDRGNERIAYLYDPLHPAMLRTMRYITDESRKGKVNLSVCGEMAADPLYALVLLGLGVDSLSMSGSSLSSVKKVIRGAHFRDAEALAKHALTLSTGAEIRAYLRDSELGRLALAE